MKGKLAVVVPSLFRGGGVPSVACFVIETAIRSGKWDVRPISLCMSSSDPESISLRKPSTWFRGVGVRHGEWNGWGYAHVGAVGGELEFQRYRRRRALSTLLMDCDVVQVVCGSPAWANAVVGLGKPVSLQVATRARVERRMRDGTARGVGGLWRKAMTEITDRMDDRALGHVDAIQLENPWMLDYARKINTARSAVDIRYAPPGVNVKIFHPAPVRALIQGYVLCVGRLDDPRKNINLLLEAYAKLPASLRDNVRLILAGSSGPPEHFWHRADDLGLCEQVSYVERPSQQDLVRLYQGASVFALPSDEEGLGVVLLEAMACGVPVVSTRSGGPDGIITDAEDGYLVPLGDAAALSSRLEGLLQDPALNLRMGDRARQTIEQRYDERVAGEIFVEMWDRLADMRPIA